MSTPPRHRALRAIGPLASLAAVAAAFLHSAAIGWGRWGDVLTDTGRELEVPRRMLEGEHLYRDLRWYYGPLAPWVNMWLYRAFGVRIEVLALAGILSAALLALALWLIVRRFADRLAATIVVVTFTYACAFSATAENLIFSFPLPYTFAATYGMLVAAWSLYFLLRHVETGRAADFHASAALAAVTAFTKVEVVVPLAGAHAVFAVAAALRRRKLGYAAAGYATAAAFVGAGYALLFARNGAALWSRNLAGVMNDAAITFIRFMMGLDRPLPNLMAMTGVTILVVAWTAAGTWLARRIRWDAVPAALRFGLAGGLFAGSVGLALWFPSDVPFLASTPVALGSLAWLARRVTTAPATEADGALARLVLWTFAAACLLRIFLRPTPVFYGFYLLAPMIACLGILLLADLPGRFAPPGWARRAVTAQASGLLLGAALSALLDARTMYAERSYQISGERGSWATQYPDLQGAIDAISRQPPGARVLVVPEGAALNFFAGRRGADSQFSYLPMELASPEDEARLVEAWTRRPPDAVVLLSLRNAEFGAGWFGIDYGRRCGAFIERNYRPLPMLAPGVSVAVPAWRSP